MQTRKRYSQRTGVQLRATSAWNPKRPIPDTVGRGETDFADAKALLNAGYPEADVRRWTCLSDEEMQTVERRREKGHLPSPDEILRRAREIRGEWTPEELELRTVHTPPVFYLPGFGWVA